MNKSGKSKEERLEVLDEQKFIKSAREYRSVFLVIYLPFLFMPCYIFSKIKKALATVTRDKSTAHAQKVKSKEDKQKPGPSAPLNRAKKFKNKKGKEIEKEEA